MITIDINKKYQPLISLPEYQACVEGILAYFKQVPNIDLAILIDSDAEIKKLNQEYRGLDQPTDVLAFESDEVNPETGNHILGDLIVSYPTADKQANEARHPVFNEIVFLTAHAILHLLGYDHDTPAQKKLMWDKQQEVMAALEIKINRISGDEEFHD